MEEGELLNAQVTFHGARLEVRSKVSGGTTDLRKITISYIGAV